VPVLYELDPDAGFIRTRCVGDVRVQEVLAHFTELATDPKLPPRLDVLLDLREITTLPETEHLRAVAGSVHRLESRVTWGACAIVATSPGMFGMSRMFEVFVQDAFARTHVFRELAEAERWLARARGEG
jgi:hypothetical protein